MQIIETNHGRWFGKCLVVFLMFAPANVNVLSQLANSQSSHRETIWCGPCLKCPSPCCPLHSLVVKYRDWVQKSLISTPGLFGLISVPWAPVKPLGPRQTTSSQTETTDAWWMFGAWGVALKWCERMAQKGWLCSGRYLELAPLTSLSQ